MFSPGQPLGKDMFRNIQLKSPIRRGHRDYVFIASRTHKQLPILLRCMKADTDAIYFIPIGFEPYLYNHVLHWRASALR